MKVGDIVRIFDGSYSLVVHGDGEPETTNGHVLEADGDYEVIGIGDYPEFTDNSSAWSLEIKPQINNLKLRCILNPERVVYTQKRLCSVMRHGLPPKEPKTI